MSTAAETLPDDVAALRVMLLEARAERDAERAEKEQIVTERDKLAAQNDRLRHLIRQLQRMQCKRCSDRTFCMAMVSTMICRFREIDLCVISKLHSNLTRPWGSAALR